MRFDYTPPWDDERLWRSGRFAIDLEGLDSKDLIMMEIAERKTFFEVDLLEHIAIHGPVGGVYLDVGANIGNHSVYFGKFLADYIVAIEPHPMLVPILKRNLRANGVTNSSLLPYAVSDRAGIGQMTLRQGLEKNIGGSQVKTLQEATTGKSDPDTVPITTLDDLLEEIRPSLGDQRITFVKIDIEGMELNALKGARRLLEKERPQLIVELATPEARATVRALLEESGYQDTGQRFCWTPTYHFIDPSVHKLRVTRYCPLPDPEAHRLDLASQELSVLIPQGEPFILVDEGWAMGLVIDDLQALPFLERDGQYAGPPPDDQTAIVEIERMRNSGAAFIVFLWPAFWWLDHYRELHYYIRSKFRCALENDRMVVFDLRS